MDPGRADYSVGAEDATAGKDLSWPSGSHLLGSPPAGPHRPAVSVLADRLAAALVHHEPGWRLPRHSALARRYSVSTAEIDAAVEELIGRHLVRRLADGQLYRASPAEYLIDLAGVPGLRSHVDAMGGEFACRNRQVSWRQPPEDISWALRVSPAEPVCVIRLLWTAGGEPAAVCTSYVPGDIAGRPAAVAGQPLPAALNLLQLSDVITGPAPGPDRPGREAGLLAGTPNSLHIEMQAPPPSVARSLRLSAGQPAMMVTVRFDDLRLGRPVALTAAVLRADMFRFVLQTAEPPLPGDHLANTAAACAEALEDSEA